MGHTYPKNHCLSAPNICADDQLNLESPATLLSVFSSEYWNIDYDRNYRNDFVAKQDSSAEVFLYDIMGRWVLQKEMVCAFVFQLVHVCIKVLSTLFYRWT